MDENFILKNIANLDEGKQCKNIKNVAKLLEDVHSLPPKCPFLIL